MLPDMGRAISQGLKAAIYGLENYLINVCYTFSMGTTNRSPLEMEGNSEYNLPNGYE
jgi:hypothetical protein